MKKALGKMLEAVFLTMAFVALAACGSSSGSAQGGGSGDSGDGFDIPSTETAFYTPATSTTPVIRSAASAMLVKSVGVTKVTTAWSSGNPVYEIFNAFREYQFPRDEGVIDVSNVYKLLFEAGNNYTSALTEVELLPSPVTIAPPFDFGNTPKTYTDASETDALTSDEGTVDAILTWIWNESPKMSYGVLEGGFNEDTGDLTLDMAYLVDYEGPSDYCLRAFISGNDTTHEFTLKLAKFNSGSGAYAISMIGAGVSQSDNPDDYFLLKIIDNDNLAEFPEGRFFRFAASSSETELMAHPVNGYALEDVSDPNGYADTIGAMTFFALDGSDHATSVGSFSDSELKLQY